MAGLSWKPQ